MIIVTRLIRVKTNDRITFGNSVNILPHSTNNNDGLLKMLYFTRSQVQNSLAVINYGNNFLKSEKLSKKLIMNHLVPHPFMNHQCDFDILTRLL